MFSKLFLVAALCLLQSNMVQPGAFGGFGGMKSLGLLNKQLGMSQAILGKSIKTAQDEVQLQIDAVKTALQAQDETDPCIKKASTTLTTIEDDLLTAFDKCSMKNELKELRFQALNFKQQFASMKACKVDPDPVACLTAANDEAGKNNQDVNAGLEDVMNKSAECVDEVKEELLETIVEVGSDILECSV